MPLKSPTKSHIFSPHPVAPAALLPGPLAVPGHRARARGPRRAGAAAAGRAAAVAPRRDGRLGDRSVTRVDVEDLFWEGWSYHISIIGLVEGKILTGNPWVFTIKYRGFL